MHTFPQYPSQPTRSIIDAVDVLAETGPTLGRPLVDRIELEPEHRELAPLFGRRLKELRPLGTDIRILFTFAPDRTLVLLYAGDKARTWNAWYRRAFRRNPHACTATTWRRPIKGDVMATTKWSEIRGRLVPADQ